MWIDGKVERKKQASKQVVAVTILDYHLIIDAD